MTTTPQVPQRLSSESGYSLAEVMVAMGIMTVVMGATMGGLNEALKVNDTVVNLTTTNNSLRGGMDLMNRDMLQVGSGLPPGHVINIPSGAGSSPVKIPGPPGTNFTTAVGETDIDAVIPGAGRGPSINGTPTDVVTVLMADNALVDIPLTAITPTSVVVAAGPDLANGPDRVAVGQLMMVSKGSMSTLLQVTDVNTVSRTLTFAANDSLNLNQPAAAAGTLAVLHAADPANDASAARISRVRMISYYLDATADPLHPRLVRRVNNGHPTTFDNTLGSAVALDIENLQFTYDLVAGNPDPAMVNPANVRMNANDIGGSGRCSPNPCLGAQVRKVNIVLSGRSRSTAITTNQALRNTLSSQVSLRGMAFVDEYRGAP